MSSSSRTSKAVCFALPLIAPPTTENEELSAALLPPSSSSASASSSTSSSQNQSLCSAFRRVLPACLQVCAGATMGLVCYVAVGAFILPLVPHVHNSIGDSAIMALIRSVITTTVGYALWFTAIAMYQTCSGSRRQEQEQECGDKELEFWEDMEYFYALGVFVGFSAACVAALVLEGVPAMIVGSVAVAAMFLCVIMAVTGRREKKKSKTVLPMVVV